MGGLSTLCCSKGDKKGDDGQETPARPVQQVPNKGTPKPDGKNDEKPDENPDEKPKVKPADRNLWEEAYNALDPKTQKLIPASDLKPEAAIDEVIETTKEKYQEWKKGGLKIRRKGGNDINLRDVSESILGAAQKGKDVISTFVSFDPTGHASSAWTIISFGMSIVQNRLDRRNAVFDSSKYLTETMTWFAIIDKTYRRQEVETDSPIDLALVRVYTAILTFGAEVKKTRDENDAERLWKSIIAFSDSALSTLKTSVEEQKAAANEWANLAADLHNRKQAKQMLSELDAIIEKTTNIESIVMNQTEREAVDWLSSVKYATRYQTLRKRRTRDTGIWLLDLQDYNDWVLNPGNLLLMKGITGCGKSVLCSTVVHDLMKIREANPSKHVAYWFFQFDVAWTKSVETMVKSLIRQLSSSPLAASLVNLFKNNSLPGNEPDPEAFLRVLDDVLSKIPDDNQVYLVFDALDECPTELDHTRERASLLFLITDLLEKHSDKVHIIATSRPEKDITKALGRFPSINLKDHVDEDVRTFVNTELSSGPLNEWDDEVKKLISSRLLSLQERRFRWAEMQLKALETETNKEALIKALDKVPETLEGTYRLVLDSIARGQRSLAREIFMMICLSPVLVEVDTVAKMMNIAFSERVMKICTTSMVTLNQDKIQVAHFSVQEYLITKENDSNNHECQFTAADGHRFLVERTVDVLLAHTEVLTEAKAKEDPHFLYAAKYWDTHLTAAGGYDQMSPELQAKINRLFSESDVYLNWLRAADSENERKENEWAKVLAECDKPIHRASLLGLIGTVESLIAQGVDPLDYSYCSHVEWWRSPELNSLGIAARVGNLDLLQILLDKKLPLEQQTLEDILKGINHRKAGKAKLAHILQTLLDQGLLYESPDATDTIDRSIVASAIENETSAVEIMNVFLEWSTMTLPIEDASLTHIFCETTSDTLAKLLFERCDVHLPKGFIEKIEENRRVINIASLAYLARERPNELPIATAVRLFASNESTKLMEDLLHTHKEKIHVTTDVLEAAVRNDLDGDMLGLLWPLRDADAEITENMLLHAATNLNTTHQREYFYFLLRELESNSKSAEPIVPESTVPGAESTVSSAGPIVPESLVPDAITAALDGVGTLKMLLSAPYLDMSVSEKMLRAICRHPEGAEMLDLLNKEKGIHVPITENLVWSAAGNEENGPSVVAYLAQLSTEPLPVTDDTLLLALENRETGADILQVLLPHASMDILDEGFFSNASLCGNTDAFAVILDLRQKDMPMDKILDELSLPHMDTGPVLQMLLSRNLVQIDEKLVERFAMNYSCMRALLSWKPDAPVNDAALWDACLNAHTMRELMAVKGDSVTITEDIVNYIIEEGQDEVIEAILLRQESLPIAEKIIWAVAEEWEAGDIAGLLEKVSASFVTRFWEKTWKNHDFPTEARTWLLLIYLKKTKANVTEDILEEFGYDAESGENYDFDEFVEKLCASEEFPDLPATERAAEIIAERCGREAIETFLDYTQVPVTESVIKAAEKNLQTDKEEVLEFLKEKSS